VNVNVTVALNGELPLPCFVPLAIVCGVVESVNVPAEQDPFGLPPPPGVTLPHENWTALSGTAGQPVNDAAAALTVIDQPKFPPFMLHMTVPAVLPLTGVVSGSGELKVIVDGVTLTLPVTAATKLLKISLINGACAMA
jgi:hypothetical protein